MQEKSLAEGVLTAPSTVELTALACRRSRWAIAAFFGLNGWLVGLWVPNIPLAKLRLELGTGVLGVTLLASALGAMIAMPVTGAVIGRFGSATVVRLTALALILSFFGPATIGHFSLFLLCLLLFGAAMGSNDVAINTHGIAVEKAMGRPIMSSLHAVFSMGAALGAGSAALILPRLGIFWFNLIMPLLGLIVAALANPFLLPSTMDRQTVSTGFAWPTRASIGLGLLCCLALMSEGAVLDWGAIVLGERHGLPPAQAGLGFGLFAAGMMVSRFFGDHLRGRFGSARLVRISGVLAALGLVVALLSTSSWLAILAYAPAGIGIGNLAPVFFAGGGRVDPEAPGRGIAAITTLGYSGFILGPPLLGLVAEVSSLGLSLMLVVLALLTIAAFANSAAAAD